MLSHKAVIIVMAGLVVPVSWVSIFYLSERLPKSWIKTPLVALNDSNGALTAPRKPIHHIYYLKIHKTGSTSIFSILAEYCRTRKLFPLLPIGDHINMQPPFHPWQVLTSPKIKKYDMVFNHHIFDSQIFKYLHNDTFKFTTLREPFSQFLSSFIYYRNFDNKKYLRAVETTNPIKTFLDNRQKYELNNYSSYTNNRQSMDLGYDVSRGFYDLSYINLFIMLTEKRFDLVLISDFFDESIILLKRKLGWRTIDILYYKKNVRDKKSSLTTQKDFEHYKQIHSQYAKADIELYNHFVAVFVKKIRQEIGLQEEVEEFKAVLKQVYTFCDQTFNKQRQVFIPAGNWTNSVLLLRSKCNFLKLIELRFTQHLKNLQKVLLKSLK